MGLAQSAQGRLKWMMSFGTVHDRDGPRNADDWYESSGQIEAQRSLTWIKLAPGGIRSTFNCWPAHDTAALTGAGR